MGNFDDLGNAPRQAACEDCNVVLVVKDEQPVASAAGVFGCLGVLLGLGLAFALHWAVGAALVAGGIALSVFGRKSRTVAVCPECGDRRVIGASREEGLSKPVPAWAKVALAAVLLVGAYLALLSIGEWDRDRRKRTSTATVSAVATEPVQPFSVLSDKKRPPHKRTVEVAIDKVLLRYELKRIAHQVRNQDAMSYDSTFIFVYRRAGGPLYATAHFNPTLEVHINGDDGTVEPLKPVAGRKVTGEWFDGRPGAGHVITIYREKGRYFSERRMKGGSLGAVPLTKKGRAFLIDPRRGHDESYLIRGDGRLELRGPEGESVIFEKR